MKPYIDAVIVVEGHNDESYLSSLVNTNIVVTNGLDVSPKLLSFLKQVSNYYKILVLSDPDKAGDDIFNKIVSCVECSRIKINIDDCNKHDKHGVAECSKEALTYALKPYFSEPKLEKKIAINYYLFSEGFNWSEEYTRKMICDKLDIPLFNRKTLNKACVLLNLDNKKLMRLFIDGN